MATLIEIASITGALMGLMGLGFFAYHCLMEDDDK